MVLLNGSHWLQALRDLQKSKDVALVEAFLLVRCVLLRDGLQLAKMETLKMQNVANNVTSIVHRDSSFVVVLKSVMTFSAAFEKEHGGTSFDTQIIDIVDNMIKSNFVTGNSRQTYQGYILVKKFLFQRPSIPNIIEDID